MTMLPRWVAWSIAAIVVACAAGLAIAVSLPHGDQGSGAPHADAAALTAYTTALRAPTSDGGRIVEEEMKPTLADFSQGRLDAASFAADARGWQIALRQVKDRIHRITVPPAIAAAGPLFDAAMDDYLAAAGLFEQAAAVPRAQRDAAVRRGIDQARAADNQYDQAALVVQRALAAAGLPADSSLPNPTPVASPG